MGEKTRRRMSSFGWQWPTIVFVVGAILLALQTLRVNKRSTSDGRITPVAYSTPGPILSGNLKIAGGDFASSQITLNRRAKLSGEFQTGSVASRVSVIVVDDVNFEKWKSQTDFVGLAVTGYVPGGKISPVLEPGIYFLIIDNRANQDLRSVRADFVLE